MRTSRTVVGLLLVALVAAISYRADAFREAMLKSSYGTINLDRVFKEVRQRADWDARLRNMEEKLTADAKNKQEAVNAKKAKLDAMPEGDAKIAAREEIAREILEAEAWFKFSRGELDREKSLMWQDLYQSMKTEAGKLAEAQGLDLVLVNDSLPEIKTTTESNVSAEAMVLQQITARRVVFASKETDVTDQLITRMNNAFAAH